MFKILGHQYGGFLNELRNMSIVEFISSWHENTRVITANILYSHAICIVAVVTNGWLCRYRCWHFDKWNLFISTLSIKLQMVIIFLSSLWADFATRYVSSNNRQVQIRAIDHWMHIFVTTTCEIITRYWRATIISAASGHIWPPLIYGIASQLSIKPILCP